MTEKETSKILASMAIAYPSFRPSNPQEVLTFWTSMLADYDYKTVDTALKAFIIGNTSAFAPSISQLIEQIQNIKHPLSAEDTSAEAWQMVRKAIARGNYHSEEDFAKFPPLVQRAVGSANQLRVWASDTGYNEAVESSNFKKIYSVLVNRQREEEKYPQALRLAMQQIGGIGHEENLRITDDTNTD